MAVRYKVKLTYHMFEETQGLTEAHLPDGFRYTGVSEPVESEFAMWCWFEDDNAGPEFDGQAVQLDMSRRTTEDSDTVVITERHILP